MESKLSCLLDNYWRRPRIVPKLGKYLGGAFGTGRGVTQVNPASPMVLNIVVDPVVRAVVEEVCRPQEAQHGMGWAMGGRHLVFMRMTEGYHSGIMSGCRTL